MNTVDDFTKLGFSLVEKTLNELLSEPMHPSLERASHYSIEGGKFLRPLITLGVVESTGQSLEKALIPACCLELIHTFSLIHDDLPCMDDDDFRRENLLYTKQQLRA